MYRGECVCSIFCLMELSTCLTMRKTWAQADALAARETPLLWLLSAVIRTIKEPSAPKGSVSSHCKHYICHEVSQSEWLLGVCLYVSIKTIFFMPVLRGSTHSVPLLALHSRKGLLSTCMGTVPLQLVGEDSCELNAPCFLKCLLHIIPACKEKGV